MNELYEYLLLNKMVNRYFYVMGNNLLYSIRDDSNSIEYSTFIIEVRSRFVLSNSKFYKVGEDKCEKFCFEGGHVKYYDIDEKDTEELLGIIKYVMDNGSEIKERS